MDKNVIVIDEGVTLESHIDSAGKVITNMLFSATKISGNINFTPDTFSPAKLRMLANQIEEYIELTNVNKYLELNNNDLHSSGQKLSE